MPTKERTESPKKKEEITKKKTVKKTAKKTEKKTEEKDSRKIKLQALKEKAEKLAEKIEVKEIGIKKKEEEQYELAPIEDFLKSSIHLGTRAITPDMKKYVYKRRADSLAVFDTTLLDKKLIEGASYLSKFPPEEVIVVCKREAGERVIELFSKVTGIKAFSKYPAGILTNPRLDDFIETELVLICDPWIDSAALEDAKKIKLPVIAICDTNNYTKDVTVVIPGNNKSVKSLGFIFYHLARLYIEKRNLKTELSPISEWIENWDNLVPPK